MSFPLPFQCYFPRFPSLVSSLRPWLARLFATLFHPLERMIMHPLNETTLSILIRVQRDKALTAVDNILLCRMSPNFSSRETVSFLPSFPRAQTMPQLCNLLHAHRVLIFPFFFSSLFPFLPLSIPRSTRETSKFEVSNCARFFQTCNR